VVNARGRRLDKLAEQQPEPVPELDRIG